MAKRKIDWTLIKRSRNVDVFKRRLTDGKGFRYKKVFKDGETSYFKDFEAFKRG